VVSVEVGDENLCFPVEAYASLNHLPLNAFATVEEDEFTFPLDGDGWQTPLGRRDASSSPEKYYL